MSSCVPFSMHERCKQCRKRQFSATRPRASPNRTGKLKAIRKPTGHFHCTWNKDWSLDVSCRKVPCMNFCIWTDSINAVGRVFIPTLIGFPMVMCHSFYLPFRPIGYFSNPSVTWLYTCIIYTLYSIPNGWIISSLGWDFSSQYVACARATQSNP